MFGLNQDEEIGIVAGVVVVVLLVVFLCFRQRRRRRFGYGVLGTEEGMNTPLTSTYYQSTNEKWNEKETLMNARFYLRSAFSYAFERELRRMGTRAEKEYFLVKHNNDGVRVMSMVLKGDDCVVPLDSENGKQTVRSLLMAIKHPYVYPTSDFDFMGAKDLAFVFREFNAKGSLRDYIYKANPRDPQGVKYGQGEALAERKVAKFGRQILEALLFLNAKGVPYSHLKTCNVMVVKGTCQLTDYENDILGLSGQLEPYVSRLVGVDAQVGAFGHVLYEMAFGYALEAVRPEYLPPALPSKIAEVLGLIFEGQDEENPVTLEQLADMPLFRDVELKERYSNKMTKFDKSMKAVLKSVREEERTGRLDTSAMIASQSFLAQSKKSRRKSKNYVTARKEQEQVDVSTTGSGAASSLSSSSSSALSGKKKSKDKGKDKGKSKGKEQGKTDSSGGAKTKPPPPPPAAKKVSNSSGGGGGGGGSKPPSKSRGALLDSITGFKGGLKKTVTNDRSGPKV